MQENILLLRVIFQKNSFFWFLFSLTMVKKIKNAFFYMVFYGYKPKMEINDTEKGNFEESTLQKTPFFCCVRIQFKKSPN